MKKILCTLLICLATALAGFCADIDEMSGQMIITGFVGNTAKSRGFKEVLEKVEKGQISGVIFFEDNIKNKEELIKMTSLLKNAKSKYPPFIAIDMEGGMVQRMNSKNGFKDYPSAGSVSKMTTEDAYSTYSDLAKTLKEVNINLNFAPCVDLAINKDSIIDKKQRSYSDDPETVIKYAREMIKAHYDNGIITSIKHFPGHGSPNGDTHLGFVDATESFSDSELFPYFNLTAENPLQTVMISHLFNKKFDTKYPASLSYQTIEKFLRVQTDFKGVIITDDLDMGAIRKNYELFETVSLAINAGENILLFSNRDNPDPDLASKISLIIKQGLIDGTILPENIINSYNRIIELKKALK